MDPASFFISFTSTVAALAFAYVIRQAVRNG